MRYPAEPPKYFNDALPNLKHRRIPAGERLRKKLCLNLLRLKNFYYAQHLLYLASDIRARKLKWMNFIESKVIYYFLEVNTFMTGDNDQTQVVAEVVAEVVPGLQFELPGQEFFATEEVVTTLEGLANQINILLVGQGYGLNGKWINSNTGEETTIGTEITASDFVNLIIAKKGEVSGEARKRSRFEEADRIAKGLEGRTTEAGERLGRFAGNVVRRISGTK